MANSNEKLGGRGQNHHRGQLWLGLCTYKCVCVYVCTRSHVCVRMWFCLGLILIEALKTVLQATICPSQLFVPSYSPLTLLPSVCLDLPFHYIDSHCHFCFNSSCTLELRTPFECSMCVCVVSKKGRAEGLTSSSSVGSVSVCVCYFARVKPELPGSLNYM